MLQGNKNSPPSIFFGPGIWSFQALFQTSIRDCPWQVFSYKWNMKSWDILVQGPRASMTWEEGPKALTKTLNVIHKYIQ